MKILSAQTDERSLSALGEEACSLLVRSDYHGLATRFGYALAFDREPAAAIQADVLKAQESPDSVASEITPSVSVKYFQPNSTGLFAAVECVVPGANGAAIHLDLIVSGKDDCKHITLESISSVTL